MSFNTKKAKDFSISPTISHLYSKPNWHTSQSYPLNMTVENLALQALYKGVCQIVCWSIFCHCHLTSPLEWSNQMIFTLNVSALGSFEWATAPLLSQYSVITDCTEETTPRFNRKFLSQTASLAASEATTYLTSMVESVIQDCFTLLKLIALPPRVNTNPKVDFLAFLSDWKLNLCTQGALDSLTGILTYGLYFFLDI